MEDSSNSYHIKSYYRCICINIYIYRGARTLRDIPSARAPPWGSTSPQGVPRARLGSIGPDLGPIGLIRASLAQILFYFRLSF